MAGKKVQELYCWSLRSGELVVNLASTSEGAAHIGLQLKGKEDCLEYFSELSPVFEPVRDEARNCSLIRAVENALKGKKVPEDLRFDIGCTEFQLDAWKTTARIPFGQTRTYGEVAEMMGRPGCARAVGQAMNRNPLPLIFP